MITGAVPSSVSVVPSKTTAEPPLASETGVLAIVMAGAPGMRVWLPRTSSEMGVGEAV